MVAVRGSPKPPPTRVSMTFPTLARAREVWFLVTGEDKAPAVRMALGGAGPLQVPAAGPRGLDRTLWMLDDAAAGRSPTTSPSPTSPGRRSRRLDRRADTGRQSRVRRRSRRACGGRAAR